MSLIQVSSTQLDTKDLLPNQTGGLNKGWRFSNRFNDVLDIPPYSQIALHSAQFAVENASFVSFNATGNGADNQPYNFRNLYETATPMNYKDVARFQDGDLEQGQFYPQAPSHFPLLMFPTRRVYNTQQDLWNELCRCMNTSGTPQQQSYIDTTTGALDSGYNGLITVTGNIENNTTTFNANPSGNTDRPVPAGILSGFKNIGSSNNTNLLKLDDLILISGKIYYNNIIGSGIGKNKPPAMFTTQFNGIHNTGTSGSNCGFTNLFAPLTSGLSTATAAIRNQQFAWGIKRWGGARAEGEIAEASSWNMMEECVVNQDAGLERYTKLAYATSLSALPPAPLTAKALWAYLWTRELIRRNLLKPDINAEFFYLLTGKLQEGIDAATGELKPKGAGISKNQVLHIFKWENGLQSYLGDRSPKLVCVATGDENVSNGYGIPYSGQLDPTSADFPAIGNPNYPATGSVYSIEDAINPLLNFNSVGLNFRLQGNRVTPQISDGIGGAFVGVSTSQNKASWDTGDLSLRTRYEELMSDIVYPLQMWGMLGGIKSSIKGILHSPAKLDEPVVVDYLGNGIEDFSSYSSKKVICPNAIYNANFAQQTPICAYPLRPYAGLITSPTRYSDYIQDVLVAGIYDADSMICLGDNNIYNPYGLAEFPATPYLPPNLTQALLYPQGVVPANIFQLLIIGNGDQLGTYNLDSNTAEDAFNRGIHIMLKNMPNKSTMGSINQGNCSKLVAMVNRFDRASPSDISTLYAYSEYEHLYVSLNNADWISTNQLSFELVDRFADYCKNIVETTMVFHLKPMDKNLIEFYRANT